MIKSSVNTGASAATKVEFPALFRSRRSNRVVLFIGRSAGFVVDGCGLSPIGYYLSDWDDCMDANSWAPLKPGDSVTLTVE